MNLRTNVLLLVLIISVSVWWFKSPTEQFAQASQYKAEQPIKAASNLSPEMRAANKQTIKGILAIKDIPLQDIKDFGYGAIPILTELYNEAETNLDKSRIAWVFWKLGWKSPEIEQALMPDLDSDDASLKVWVQWGIAKSTDNNAVIKKLLYNLENDSSAFVRDKAACALASDFVHVSPIQRITILRGLVEGLSNSKQQVRSSSITALKVQTGQTKNYVASADAQSRAKAIATWDEWLNEYERNL